MVPGAEKGLVGQKTRFEKKIPSPPHVCYNFPRRRALRAPGRAPAPGGEGVGSWVLALDVRLEVSGLSEGGRTVGAAVGLLSNVGEH